MAIELPTLPFATNDLEPYISRQSLEFHYGKHHKHYVDVVNELVHETSLDKKNIEEIMFAAFQNKEKLYNNAAQAWNHTFFWSCMDRGMSPSLELRKSIKKYFGSFDDFKNDFEMECTELFGSGWVWLVKDKKGKLKIRSLGNAGNPLVELDETPLLTCDVWEHAYYLDYQNERNKFVENFWNVVNWDFVEENLNTESRDRIKMRVAG